MALQFLIHKEMCISIPKTQRNCSQDTLHQPAIVGDRQSMRSISNVVMYDKARSLLRVRSKINSHFQRPLTVAQRFGAGTREICFS
jgi:hypothetical protein